MKLYAFIYQNILHLNSYRYNCRTVVYGTPNLRHAKCWVGKFYTTWIFYWLYFISENFKAIYFTRILGVQIYAKLRRYYSNASRYFVPQAMQEKYASQYATNARHAADASNARNTTSCAYSCVACVELDELNQAFCGSTTSKHKNVFSSRFDRPINCKVQKIIVFFIIITG